MAPDWDAIVNSVKERAMNIIKRSDAVFYAPAASVAGIVKAFINDEKAEMPISAVLKGECGLREIALRVPAIVGKEGLVKIIEYDLTDEEITKLKNLLTL